MILGAMGNQYFACLGFPPTNCLNSIMDNNVWKLLVSNAGCYCSITITSIIISNEDDEISWLDLKQVDNKLIKNYLFKSLPNVPWAKAIWFKGFSINHATYSWMEPLNRLKTLDKMMEKGWALS